MADRDVAVKRFLFVASALLAGLLIGGIIFLAVIDDDAAACRRSGGSWEVDHYIPIIVFNGKTQTQVLNPVYECR